MTVQKNNLLLLFIFSVLFSLSSSAIDLPNPKLDGQCFQSIKRNDPKICCKADGIGETFKDTQICCESQRTDDKKRTFKGRVIESKFCEEEDSANVCCQSEHQNFFFDTRKSCRDHKGTEAPGYACNEIPPKRKSESRK